MRKDTETDLKIGNLKVDIKVIYCCYIKQMLKEIVQDLDPAIPQEQEYKFFFPLNLSGFAKAIHLLGF